MPYAALQTLLDPLWGPGASNYFRSGFLSQLESASVQAVLPFRERRPRGAAAEFHLHHMGGAIDRVPRDGTAYAGRGVPYVWNVVTRWEDGPVGADENVGWARDLGAALEPYSTGGSYVNFIGDGDPSRVGAAYPPDTYQRLAEVKATYDPDNVFQLNQNIVPATTAPEH